MPRARPRAVRKYSDEFKLTAVRLSQQRGLQVKTVAAALEIHPFMLSKWRKDARDGRLRGRAPKAPPPGPSREIAQLQALEKAHALLQEEHELLKKPFGSVPLEGRQVRLHRHATCAIQRSVALPALRRDARRVLCLAPARREPACGAGPTVGRGDRAAVRRAPGALRQSAALSRVAQCGLGGEPAPRCAADARGRAPRQGGARATGRRRTCTGATRSTRTGSGRRTSSGRTRSGSAT